MSDGLVTVALGLTLVTIVLVIILGIQSDKIDKLQRDNKAWNYCLDDYAFNNSIRGFNECVQVYRVSHK